MRRRTTKPRRPPPESVLHARVPEKDTFWSSFKKVALWLLLLAGLLAVIGGGFRAYPWVSKMCFYQNPQFRLRVITLNSNPVIDEAGVAAVLGIDLSASPNLFEIDVKEVTRKLRQVPAIANASAERHMPDTLAVTVTPRLPKAWISATTAGLAETRHEGGMLVDRGGVPYPCPPLQLKSCASLPILVMPTSGKQPIKAGMKIDRPEVERCFLLLEAAQEADPNALQWIDSIRQVNAWSLLLVTRQGTAATFGLSDHSRQVASLRAALDHASEKGYAIATINLIPKFNIPITLREDTAQPLRAVPVSTMDEPAQPLRAIPVSTKDATAKPARAVPVSANKAAPSSAESRRSRKRN